MDTQNVANCFDVVKNHQWEKFIDLTKSVLPKQMLKFKAGSLSNNIKFWKELTSDFVILNHIKSYKIEFSQKPVQNYVPFQYRFSKEENTFIEKQIKEFLSKEIIKNVEHEEGEFISNIFLRPKKDGSFRIILNLENLNENVVYKHFKMETFSHALSLITHNCWLASIDWKDAYYTLKIHPSSKKFLRFSFNNELYEFTCLPMGLSSGPRIFSKVVKPLFADLRKKGFMNSSYIDDSLLVGETYQECQNNVIQTTFHSIKAGFTVHPEKSVFVPCQVIEFLGFIIDTRKMKITLPERKKLKLVNACDIILKKNKCLIRELSQLLGNIVATFPAAQYGPLHYRTIEREKIVALKQNNDNYDSVMIVTDECKTEILWWKQNINNLFSDISHGSPQIILTSDASKTGWGGVNNTTGETASGFWNEKEAKLHINFLELLAAWFTVKSLCKNVSNVHILLRLDNSTAVSYLEKMGGRKKSLNKLSRILWQWAINHGVWFSATYLPGANNVQADKLSRLKISKNDNTEWKLNSKIFKKLVKIWGKPDIDLFASRHNTQVKKFVAWKPDPMAFAINAFYLSWCDSLNYIFPPFSQIHKVLQKIDDDKAECIIIVPFWSTQAWFSKLLHMLIDCPIFLPRQKDTLTHPFRRETELPKTRLIGCRLSGKRYKHFDFLKTVKTSFCRHGNRPLLDSTTRTQENISTLHIRNTLIRIHRLWEM